VGDIRKSHPPAFKLKVFGEAIAGHSTLAQLSSKYCVNSTMISKWKMAGSEVMLEFFSKGGARAGKNEADNNARLMEIIGKLTVENDFLKKKLGILAQTSRKG
jgi:transposase-like protein